MLSHCIWTDVKPTDCPETKSLCDEYALVYIRVLWTTTMRKIYLQLANFRRMYINDNKCVSRAFSVLNSLAVSRMRARALLYIIIVKCIYGSAAPPIHSIYKTARNSRANKISQNLYIFLSSFIFFQNVIIQKHVIHNF